MRSLPTRPYPARGLWSLTCTLLALALAACGDDPAAVSPGPVTRPNAPAKRCAAISCSIARLRARSPRPIAKRS